MTVKLDDQSGSNVWIYFGETYHARFLPLVHKFRYPVLYMGVELRGRKDSPSNVKSVNNFLFSWSKRGSVRSILSFDPGDYMEYRQDKPSGDLYPSDLFDRVICFLKDRNYPGWDEIVRVRFISMPRLFGYAFNPVSFYYCYNSHDDILHVVLEVHNTFGESHVYVLSPGSESAVEPCRQGYMCTCRLKRSFHVSPFNDISGDYLISTTDPLKTGSLDVHVLYTEKSAEGQQQLHVAPQERKKFMASVSAKATVFTLWSFLYFAIFYPITILMTMPRITYEAFKLAYLRHLPVYPRPDPIHEDSIERLEPDILEQYCMKQSLQRLRNSLAIGKRLVINHPLKGRQQIVLFRGDDSKQQQQLTLTLKNYDFFVWVFYHRDLKEALDLLLFEKRIEPLSTEERNEVLDLLQRAFANRPRLLIEQLLFPSRHKQTKTSRIQEKSSLFDTVQLFVYTTGLLVFHVLFDLCTPWAKGTTPSPWSRLSRYRKSINQ